MDLWKVFPTICGFEQVGPDQLRLYVDSPDPVPRFDRPRGTRSDLFRLYSGEDARAILAWLSRNKAWQALRVPPPLTPERGVRAVLAASDWHGGEASALFAFARGRTVADDAHRRRLQAEVRLLIGSVIENPVRAGELQELQAIEDAVNAAPVGAEVCTSAEVVTAFFGA